MIGLPSRSRSLLGVALFLTVEVIARAVVLPEEPTSADVARSLILEWAMFLFLLLFWIPKLEGATLRSLGVASLRWRHVLSGLVAYVISIVPLSILGAYLASRRLPTLQSLQPLLATYSFPTLLGLVVTGVILEEFLYRGYLIERLSTLTGHRWPAYLVSFLAFTLVHWRFVGFYPMLQIAVISAILVALYVLGRSVWPCSVMHGLNSLVAYLLFPMALR